VTDRNVLGGLLEKCSVTPLTGWFRDGSCRTDRSDIGRHVVCAMMTEPFLEFTRRRGNDLTRPALDVGFPGLEPGDYWCLCAERWREALEEGVAPPVWLAATHSSALEVVTLDDLVEHAVDPLA
jgi:uncharacterized protein (DUF2237 family)